jgi:hypothetical protein
MNVKSAPLGCLSICLIGFVVLLAQVAMSTISAADDARPDRIRIEYAPPRNSDHQDLYELLKQRRALESLQQIFNPIRLPGDLTLRTVGCDGVSNAWYQQSVVSVCYEYLREIQEMAPQDTTASGITPSDAMLGQFFYVFAHEFGHAIYDLLPIPVLGTEEDAADYFSAYMMLMFGQDQARRLIIGAGYAYSRYLANPRVTIPLVAFSGSHSPPAQRFFNLMCLAYGSDSTGVFADLVDMGYLTPTRAPRCRREFNRLSFAFRELIVPHMDKERARQVLDTKWLPQPLQF